MKEGVWSRAMLLDSLGRMRFRGPTVLTFKVQVTSFDDMATNQRRQSVKICDIKLDLHGVEKEYNPFYVPDYMLLVLPIKSSREADNSVMSTVMLALEKAYLNRLMHPDEGAPLERFVFWMDEDTYIQVGDISDDHVCPSCDKSRCPFKSKGQLLIEWLIFEDVGYDFTKDSRMQIKCKHWKKKEE